MAFHWSPCSCLFPFFSYKNCGKIHNIKFTILTILKYTIQNFFVTPNGSPIPINCHFPFPPSPHSLATPKLLSVTMDLSILYFTLMESYNVWPLVSSFSDLACFQGPSML